jgi:hypothetical protein
MEGEDKCRQEKDSWVQEERKINNGKVTLGTKEMEVTTIYIFILKGSEDGVHIKHGDY